MSGFVPAPIFCRANTIKTSTCKPSIGFSSKFLQSFSQSLNSQKNCYLSLKRTRSNLTCSSSSDFPDLKNKLCKIGILVSGSGRSLENLCERIQDSKLENCEISVVVASKKTAKAIQKAENFGIPTKVLRAKDFDQDTKLFSEAITDIMDEFEVDLIVMAGWMHFFLIPERYDNRVINIHPSLIPSFCGKGYYGDRVHEAVLKFGAKVTGCTVHLADNEYDHGPIIVQKAVSVVDGDDSNSLATRVFEQEKEALPEAIQLFIDGRLSLENGVIRVKEKSVSMEA